MVEECRYDLKENRTRREDLLTIVFWEPGFIYTMIRWSKKRSKKFRKRFFGGHESLLEILNWPSCPNWMCDPVNHISLHETLLNRLWFDAMLSRNTSGERTSMASIIIGTKEARIRSTYSVLWQILSPPEINLFPCSCDWSFD